MNNYNFDKIEQEIKEFINDLNINDLNYIPSKKGYNKNGQKLQLGFFCYALKTLLTLNDEKIQIDLLHNICFLKFVLILSSHHLFINYVI